MKRVASYTRFRKEGVHVRQSIIDSPQKNHRHAADALLGIGIEDERADERAHAGLSYLE